MVGAIGSSTYVGGGGASAAPDPQLAQYEAALSDWVHCPSCNTPEGKAKIAQISDKIHAIKQTQQAAEDADQAVRAAAAAVKPTVQALSVSADSPSSATYAIDPSRSALSVNSNSNTIGSRLNAFA